MVELISKLLKKKPRERIRIPEIMKSKWFKQFGLSFNSEEIKNEQPMEDLLSRMQGNNFADPFSRQSVAEEQLLEEEIQEEMLEISRQRKIKLKNLRVKMTQIEGPEDDMSPTERRRLAKSAEKIKKSELEESGGLSVRNFGHDTLSIHAGKKSSQFKPMEHMRIYYRQNMEVIHKDSEDMDEALISKISKLTNTDSIDVDQGYAVETSGTPKSVQIIDEIDREYDKFERMPMDACTQTTEQIVDRH